MPSKRDSLYFNKGLFANGKGKTLRCGGFSILIRAQKGINDLLYILKTFLGDFSVLKLFPGFHFCGIPGPPI